MFASHTGRNTLASAKSMLEWMCSACQKELDEKGKNVFELKELVVCQTMGELKAAVKPGRPFVCVATSEAMDGGLSQQLFLEWTHANCKSQAERNLVLLTQRTDARSLAGKLLELVRDEASERRVDLDKVSKVPLTQLEREALEPQPDDEEVKESENEPAADEPDDAPLNKISKSASASASNEAMEVDAAQMAPAPQHTPRRASSAQCAFAMYPFGEHEQAAAATMTAYGVDIELDEWRAEPERGRAGQAAEPADEFESLSKSASPSQLPTLVLAGQSGQGQAPHNFKTVRERVSLAVRCQVKFVNVEGRSDADSVLQTLPLLRPKRMLVVHGSAAQKARLAAQCVADKVCGDVAVPRNGEWTRVATNTRFRRDIMDDRIEKRLAFRRLNGFEVAFLHGTMRRLRTGGDGDEDMDGDMDGESATWTSTSVTCSTET